MTDREKAIVMAYTGITMLTGEKFKIFHEYIQKILGRPVWTHELADKLVWNEIKEKSKNDFLEICKTEERPQGEWVKKEDVIHHIAKQYSAHNEVVPIWLSIADMRGGRE